MTIYSFYCNAKNCHHRNGDESLSIEDLKVLYKEIKLQKCGQCSSVFYCSKDCQLYDWSNGHKRQCKLIVDHRNSICNDPNVVNGAVPGSTYQFDRYTPAKSVQAHVLKQYNPRDGHERQSLSKSKKFFNSLPQLQRKTYEFMIIIVIKTILSDQWDRIERNLTPRPSDFIYQFGIDMITNADDDEILELWKPQINDFKSWCWRASSEGRLFEFMNDTAAYLSTFAKLLETFMEWEPKSPDYDYPVYATVLATIASGLANQQFYLVNILNPESRLNKYVDILISWSNLNDLPYDHFWHKLIELLINGLVVGVEFSEKFFDAVDPSLLVVLKPVLERHVQVLSERIILEPFEPTDGDDLKLQINKFNAWNGQNNGGKGLSTIYRAVKYVCPELDISPVRFIWQWHINQHESMIRKYPESFHIFSEQYDMFNELESLYLMMSET